LPTPDPAQPSHRPKCSAKLFFRRSFRWAINALPICTVEDQFELGGEIRSGEIVIVEGPSGSGKTTLLTLLGTLRSPQEGEIDILGQRLDKAGKNVML